MGCCSFVRYIIFFQYSNVVIIKRDNTCEINLLDVIEKKDVRPDQFEKGDSKDTDTIAGRYITKLRRSAVRTFTKKATA